MHTTAGSLALADEHRGARFVRRRAVARRRRGDPRQDESQRVGELPLDAFVERMERARRTDAQSVRARSNAVGLELRVGIGDRRELLRRRHRHGDRRLGDVARGGGGARRHQADGRTDQPRRHHSDRAQPGHRRPDGAHGSRRRDSARRAHRRRSARLGDARQRGALAHRLHARRSTRTGCAARASASRESDTRAISAETDKLFAARARSDEAARRDDRRSRRHRDGRAGRTTPSSRCCCTSSRPT